MRTEVKVGELRVERDDCDDDDCDDDDSVHGGGHVLPECRYGGCVRFDGNASKALLGVFCIWKAENGSRVGLAI